MANRDVDDRFTALSGQGAPVSTLSIVHVVVTLERGGLERLVTDLAIAQFRAGHRVAVFCLNDAQGYADTLRGAGVEVVMGHKRGGFDLGVLGRLRALIGQSQADVVHAHGFVPNYYAAATLWTMRGGPALVGTCHDMGTRLSNRRLRWFYQASLWRTDRVAMVGRQVHERFVNGGLVAAENAVTVLNAVPLERFVDASAGRAKAREALGLSASALVLGCVGRLVGLKNHRLMIALMPQVLAQHPDAMLLLLGGGELAEALRAQAAQLGIADHVMLAGERPDVAGLLPAMDLFVMPSLTEGVSIALLEACAAGLPVVATDVGGNPEIIASGERGLLVPPDDGPATLSAMLSLLSSPARRQQLGDAARNWVRAHASLEALTRCYDRLYDDAIASRKGARRLQASGQR